MLYIFKPGGQGSPGYDAAYCSCPQRTSYDYNELIKPPGRKPNNLEESESRRWNKAESLSSDQYFYDSSQSDHIRLKKLKHNRQLFNKTGRKKKQFQKRNDKNESN